MKFDKSSLLLYAVTDRHWLCGRRLIDDVREALEGGVTFVQLREKDDMALPHDEFLQEAKEIQSLCKEYHVPFVLDDDVALALECGADGVHVGQSDMEADDVRALLGPDKILGVSAQTVEQAVRAEKMGADYLGVGAVFATGSKDDAKTISKQTLKDICAAVSIPVIAIGGINADNVSELAGTGIVGISVISAIFAQPDPQQAAKELRQKVVEMLKR